MNLSLNIYNSNKFRKEFKSYGLKEGTLYLPIKPIEEMDLKELREYITFFNGINCDSELYNKLNYLDKAKLKEELQERFRHFIQPDIYRLYKLIFKKEISYQVFDLYWKHSHCLSEIELILEVNSMRGKESEIGIDRIVEVIKTEIVYEYNVGAGTDKELERKESVLDKIVIKY